MKTFCDTFNHWLYHPVDTSLICNHRLLKLPECRRCKGIENPKKQSLSKESIQKLIPLNVDRKRWMELVRELQEEYNIREGSKQDEVSARRIAILLGEVFVIDFRDRSDVVRYVPIVEKDGYDLALEYRLACDPLERESRVKPDKRRLVLHTWGVDKTSGMEGYTSQLKEWSIRALLETQETEEEVVVSGDTESGSFDAGSRPSEEFRLEEAGIG